MKTRLDHAEQELAALQQARVADSAARRLISRQPSIPRPNASNRPQSCSAAAAMISSFYLVKRPVI